MRILYISQYFPPEAGATQTRAFEMARNWVQLGHQVTILTEFPNHPSGIIPVEYKGKFFERAELEGINVIRVWVKASPEKSLRNRILFYLSFMFNAFIAGLFLAHCRYELIYATSPPLFVGGAALFLSYLKRVPLVFEVRDLWPESAVALGELQNSLAISFATRLESMCYRRARLIPVVTQGIINRLIERDIPEHKILLVSNGANIDLFHFMPEERERIRTELGLSSKFVAIYAGIHGLAQGLETVVEAAQKLVSIQDIHIIFIGEGPKKAEVTALAQQYHLANLTLLPEKPREQIPSYLSAADVSLIPLRNIELFKGALPSKIFDAWACQRPVILSVEGEASHVVEQAQGGIFVQPENPAALAKTLIQLRDNPMEREKMGKNGRIFTEKNYSRAAIAKQLINTLEGILKE